MSHSPNTDELMDLGKGKRIAVSSRSASRRSGRREFFICQRLAAPSIVTPRAALESGGVAHCGRLR
jgi:hypothetical protein